jgi:molybdate transport system substrate-binding protein
MKRQRLLGFVILLLLSIVMSCCVRLPSSPEAIAPTQSQLTVAAAASLTDALDELTPFYRQSNANTTVRYNFASSGALQQQIVNGAPADVFISAAAKQMDALQQKNLLLVDTRRNVLTNRLVLIVPVKGSQVTSLTSLTDMGVKRIAIGDPSSVPAGQYAEEALTKAGLWTQLQPKYVLASNVRQVLQFVEAGNADAGLVYLTDARMTDQVKIAQTLPTNLHSPIVYPIAVLKNSRNPTASRSFVEFLFSSAAQKVFEKYGFSLT